MRLAFFPAALLDASRQTSLVVWLVTGPLSRVHPGCCQDLLTTRGRGRCILTGSGLPSASRARSHPAIVRFMLPEPAANISPRMISRRLKNLTLTPHHSPDRMVKRAEDARVSHLVMVVVLFLQAVTTWSWWWAIAWALLFIGLTRAAGIFRLWRFGTSEGDEEDAQREYEKLVKRCRISRWTIFVLMLAAWGASSIELV